jgi:hypothetical protein
MHPQNPRERHITIPDASYTSSKLFELDLSPILEDSRTFSEPLDATQESNSSNSSYGELLEEGVSLDCFSFSQRKPMSPGHAAVKCV